ncbi:MAG TPA: acyltransferase [Stellaceae bacterium]|nr:acyltransferase [Stellaceae bacterium]
MQQMFERVVRDGITSTPVGRQRRPPASDSFPSSHDSTARRAADSAAATRPIPSIQVLRALAALAVIYTHIRYDFRIKFGVADFPTSLGPLDDGVDMFFVISGFIMVYASERLFQRRGGSREFLMRRLLRIVPLYWATSLVALAYILVRQRPEDLMPTDVFYKWSAASFLFLPYPRTNGELSPLNGVGWTLEYEMFFYAVFAAAVWLSRRGAVAAITLLFAALILVGLRFGPLPTSFAVWCDPLILEFVFGMLIAVAFRDGVRLPSWLARGIVLAGLAGFLLAAHFGFEASRALQAGLPSGLVVAGLTLSAASPGAQSAGIVTRAFCFLGEASYSIYLVHPFALTAPRLLHFGLSGNEIAPPAQPWLYASLQLVAALAAGVIVHVGIERPITRALRRVPKPAS